MAKEIVNRVTNSHLMTIDLEDFYLEGPRIAIDISKWLHEGFILKEQEFRAQLKEQDWTPYQNGYIALYCSTDAIIPGWAYMLVSLELASYAKKLTVGNLEDLEAVLYSEIIQNMSLDKYLGKPVIIKGCAVKPIPDSAYVLLAQKLHPIAKSIMYGEACSSVPLFKNK
jgi:hypothetical protein